MNQDREHDEEDLIDLGAVTSETHGNFGTVQPDSPQNRIQLGVLAD
ncbi:benenodin family lasso peptide [Novosphingobium album (ex Liu et al. 2023)]|uniref:Benenodin family lasso peptide n=1 Tax=Novosphingobium album (ex Liu et al. 2023) TaxID=3031130 RepID=A0ABT5WQI1_9SPHN|nr:benenodin family lasso peptide [Novosphingobium album (ex Liu et al. 2023)]MDE8652261.1 benenodin family lasso peptide [Novosphingobium album (ex Liu et al. 2023)]